MLVMLSASCSKDNGNRICQLQLTRYKHRTHQALQLLLLPLLLQLLVFCCCSTALAAPA
jgi:hypothetical protein